MITFGGIQVSFYALIISSVAVLVDCSERGDIIARLFSDENLLSIDETSKLLLRLNELGPHPTFEDLIGLNQVSPDKCNEMTAIKLRMIHYNSSPPLLPPSKSIQMYSEKYRKDQCAICFTLVKQAIESFPLTAKELSPVVEVIKHLKEMGQDTMNSIPRKYRLIAIGKVLKKRGLLKDKKLIDQFMRDLNRLCHAIDNHIGQTAMFFTQWTQVDSIVAEMNPLLRLWEERIVLCMDIVTEGSYAISYQ